MRRLASLLAAAVLLSAPLAASATVSPNTVVLGSAVYAGRYGVGWGKPHPSEIFNGGDPSGLVRNIRWTGWGGTAATGQGLNAIFKPTGGYYGKLATIQLRANDLGRCTSNGPLAYRRLFVRVPSRPGGPLGRWLPWGGSKTLCKFRGLS